MVWRGLLMLGLVGGVAVGQGGGAENASTVLVQPPSSEGCPVGLGVRRLPEGRVSLAGRGMEAQPEARLRLTFARRGTPELEGVDGVVHGRLPDAGVMLTGSTDGGEATESFSVERQGAERGLPESRLVLRRLSGVSWVELTSIRYADGTRWTASGRSRCVAEPNGVLLVGAR